MTAGLEMPLLFFLLEDLDVGLPNVSVCIEVKIWIGV